MLKKETRALISRILLKQKILAAGLFMLLLSFAFGANFILDSVARKQTTKITARITIPTVTSQPTETPTPTPFPTVTPTPTILPTFTPTPTPTAFNIAIEGDDVCVTQTQDALNLLKSKAPSHYENVIKYIGVIECVESGSGMSAYMTPPRFKVGKATRDTGTIWYAGTIVHDAHHSKQYNDYLSTHPNESVPTDVWSGAQAERECLDIQYNALQQIGAPQSYLDHVQKSKETEYWNIPEENRWW
jgi:hypothetical protein